MYNKPITQKAKSPLKAVDGPGDIIMKNTEVKKGTDGTPGTPGKKKTILYSDLPESQRAAAREYNMKKYGTHNPTAEGLADNTIVTEGTEGTPGTPDTEETTTTPIYTRDETDAIRPYGAYQNRIVERREGGALERKSKRAVKNLAKRYAQDTDDDGKKGFGKIMSNRKQRRDFRRGADGVNYKDDATKEKVQELRDYRDGVSDVQLDMSDNVQTLERARDQRKQGASGNDAVISDPRLANQTDILATDVQGQLKNSVGNVEFTPFKKMYDKNVGIKTASPMKKGYFKGK